MWNHAIQLSDALDTAGDPCVWRTRAVWNHARIMDNAAKRRGMELPRLTAQDLSDITTYLAGLGSGPRSR